MRRRLLLISCTITMVVFIGGAASAQMQPQGGNLGASINGPRLALCRSAAERYRLKGSNYDSYLKYCMDSNSSKAPTLREWRRARRR